MVVKSPLSDTASSNPGHSGRPVENPRVPLETPSRSAVEAERKPRHRVLLKQRWADYQHRNSLKSTSQRELIVDVFLNSEDHVSIDELLAQVRNRNPRVGYATVYRTMRLLVAAGLAAPRQFGDGQTRYEVTGPETPHHDHLICIQCGLILEFENCEIELLQDKVAERLGGFKIVQHKLELYGLCPKAQHLPSGRCPNEERQQKSSPG
jgi:Fur family ferric uptake transcriptional regulator